MLLESNKSVTDVTFSLGFNSIDVFTRAFKRAFGETSTAMRERIAWRLVTERYIKKENIFATQERREIYAASVHRYLKGDLLVNGLTQLSASPFTLADKRECLPTVETIINLANIARREGVLALEEAVNGKDTPFFLHKAVSLVVDGTNPDLVREIMQNFILSSHYQGAELLKRLLILDGVLALQAGENPRIIVEKLLSLMGEQFYDEGYAYLFPEPQTMSAAVKDYFADMETETFPEGTNLLEEIFSKLSNRDIQVVLRGLDKPDFLCAFRGSSKKIQRRLCNNLSMRMAALTVEACANEPMPATSEILRAQRGVLALLKRISESGEIIVGMGAARGEVPGQQFSATNPQIISTHVYRTSGSNSTNEKLSREEIEKLLSAEVEENEQ